MPDKPHDLNQLDRRLPRKGTSSKTGRKPESPVNRPDTALLKALQEIQERKLIDDYILPLLEALGYRDAHFHGGAYEEGKDIIAWEEDRISGINLHTFQVRRKPISARAAGFTGIVASLLQSLTQDVQHPNGKGYKPAKVYYVTPYRATTRALASCSGLLSENAHRLCVLDGPALLDLIRRNIPRLYNQLHGTVEQLRAAHATLLDNRHLLDAMRARQRRPIETFYISIDFALDRKRTQLLIAARKAVDPTPLEVSQQDWQETKNLDEACKSVLGVPLLAERAAAVKTVYARAYAAYERLRKPWQQRHDALMSNIRPLESSVRQFEEDEEGMEQSLAGIESKISHLQAAAGQLRRKRAGTESELHLVAGNGERAKGRGDKILRQIDGNIAANDQMLVEYRRQRDAIRQRALAREKEQKVAHQHLEKLREDLNRLNASKPVPPCYMAEHNVSKVLAELEHKRNQHQSPLADGSLDGMSSQALREWLVGLKQLQDIGGRLATTHAIVSKVGVDRFGVGSEAGEPRVSIGLGKILDSGTNFALLGDAGSGKSTTLQMYARQCLGMPGSGPGRRRNALFVPLTQLANVDNGRIVNPQELRAAIRGFFRREDRHVDPQLINSICDERDGIILLDGLDEVIGSNPNMGRVINDFAKGGKCQVVVSSRYTSSEVSDLPLLAVRMLPFSDVQQVEFVKRWFDGEREKEKSVLRQIRDYSELREAVRSPLLLTILCCLRDTGQKLPSTETTLFAERSRLLLGDYDRHKGARRVTAPSELLRECCNCIAYGLHKRNRRVASLIDLTVIAREKLAATWGEEFVDLSVKELAEPCCVLVEMAVGGYGFGHLRFQEYYAACELRGNREIDMLPLLFKGWWRGVCMLYAKMAVDLNWLIERGAEGGIGGVGAECLKAMIAVCPGSRRIHGVNPVRYVRKGGHAGGMGSGDG